MEQNWCGKANPNKKVNQKKKWKPKTNPTNPKTQKKHAETNEQGFLAKTEQPTCPQCGHKGHPVLAKNNEGLQGLHCRKCLRILNYIGTASEVTDRENRHYAVVGDRAYGKGDTKEEAVENMKKNLDSDASNYYKVYVSNKPITVTRYGEVVSEKGIDVYLHQAKTSRIKED